MKNGPGPLVKIMKNLDSSAEQQSHEETTVSTSAEKRWWWVELAKNLFQMDNANTLKK